MKQLIFFSVIIFASFNSIAQTNEINKVELSDSYYLCIACGNKLFHTKDVEKEEDGTLKLHSHFDKSHVYIDDEGNKLFCGTCKSSVGHFKTENKKAAHFVKLENELVELDDNGNVVCAGCGGLLSEDHEHEVLNKTELNLDLAFKERLPAGINKSNAQGDNKSLIHCGACKKYIGYENFDDQNWSFNYSIGLNKIKLFKRK